MIWKELEGPSGVPGGPLTKLDGPWRESGGPQRELGRLLLKKGMLKWGKVSLNR